MSGLTVLLISVGCGVVFFGVGSFIGTRVAKAQKKRDEVLKNGSKHI